MKKISSTTAGTTAIELWQKESRYIVLVTFESGSIVGSEYADLKSAEEYYNTSAFNLQQAYKYINHE